MHEASLPPSPPLDREPSKASCHSQPSFLSRPPGSLSDLLLSPSSCLLTLSAASFALHVDTAAISFQEKLPLMWFTLLCNILSGTDDLEGLCGVHPWAIELILKRGEWLAGSIPGKKPKKEGRTFYF